MNIAIIGAGLIGRKRAAAMRQFAEDRIRIVCDIDDTAAGSLAREHDCEITTDWHEAVIRADVDAVIVATVNAVLEPVTMAALEAGKDVLCEKPLGRSVDEARRMVDMAREHGRILKTGFNHRFHPALMQARRIVGEGGIGEVFSIRARYGHGGRPGMEREWRASKELCGGGELLDQGVHVIDLIRWFGGEIAEVYARVETKFWDMSVEDNAFAIITSESGVTASMHVSWTNWKNVFSFEVFGKKGSLVITVSEAVTVPRRWTGRVAAPRADVLTSNRSRIPSTTSAGTRSGGNSATQRLPAGNRSAAARTVSPQTASSP